MKKPTPSTPATPERKEEIVSDICRLLHPLKDNTVNPATDVKAHLELHKAFSKQLASLTQTGEIAREAKKARTNFQQSTLGRLLREAMPGNFEEIDRQYEFLENVTGPHKKAEPLKRDAALTARALIHQMSSQRATGTTNGPMRTIASLIFEWHTGEAGLDLKRACDDELLSWEGIQESWWR